MIRLGVLASAGGWHVEDLERAAQTTDVQVRRLAFTHLTAVAGPAELRAGSCAVDRLDALLVRTMPAGSLEQVIFRMDWLQRAEATGHLVVNPPRTLEACIDKYLATARLEASGMAVPRTVACESAGAAQEAFDTLGRDVVVKPLFGSEGRGLERVRSLEQARARFAALADEGRIFYLQQFVPHPGYDYRVFVLGGEARWCIRRHAVGDWRTNLACGGRAEPMTPSREMTDLATRAAQALGAEVAGVDLLPDETGRLWLLEVNAVPGWKALSNVCKVDVAAEILEYVKLRVLAKAGHHVQPQ